MQMQYQAMYDRFSGKTFSGVFDGSQMTVCLVIGVCSQVWSDNLQRALTGFCTLLPMLPEQLSGARATSPDLLLWLGFPANFQISLPAWGCPTACCLEQGSPLTSSQQAWLLQFEHVFLPQQEQLTGLCGRHAGLHWLPSASNVVESPCSAVERRSDVALRQASASGLYVDELRTQLGNQVSLYVIDDNLAGGGECADNALVLVLDRNDAALTPVLFEALAGGSLVVTDRSGSGPLSQLFSEGEEYVSHCKNDLAELIMLYLEHGALREQIAARGRSLVQKAHTWRHRMQDLLAVTLRGKPDTYSPAELRERSLASLSDPLDSLKQSLDPPVSRRSFVIPVLDYSPASCYNIRTLLDDLETIEGEVLVIFNSAELGAALGGHPRITRHAIMKQNVGVARAWNIGVSLADTDTVFILNADCHVTGEAVEQLHAALHQLPDACCVGPQGSFVNFSLCRDYVYFGKGSFSAPQEVDAVSGFFFAIRRDLFRAHGILFDEAYSPCYFEEWDTALQIRLAGLRSYIVPTIGYGHQWGGTIRSLRTIPYLGKEATAHAILQRNRQFFLAKWRSLSRRLKQPQLLESGWRSYLWNCLELALAKSLPEETSLLAARYLQDYPDDPRAAFLTRFAALHQAKQDQSLQVHQPILETMS